MERTPECCVAPKSGLILAMLVGALSLLVPTLAAAQDCAICASCNVCSASSSGGLRCSFGGPCCNMQGDCADQFAQFASPRDLRLVAVADRVRPMVRLEGAIFGAWNCDGTLAYAAEEVTPTVLRRVAHSALAVRHHRRPAVRVTRRAL
jgi:hypothetical protein